MRRLIVALLALSVTSIRAVSAQQRPVPAFPRVAPEPPPLASPPCSAEPAAIESALACATGRAMAQAKPGPAPMQSTARPPRSTAWAIAASAAVPGAGQAILGVDRFIPYLAVEAFLWIQYAAHARDARRERDAYRGLAARVARGDASGTLPNGDFDYYERMKHYPESGRFTLQPGGVLVPETDTTTYNGAMWLLARRTYWSDVSSPPDTASLEWRLAVDFYRRRGYGDAYQWSWGAAPLEYGEFRRLMRRSNESNRKALQNLGVVIANHLLSTVDALVTVRLRRRLAGPGGGEGWALEGEIPLSRFVP